MRTLVHSICWCPEGLPGRQEGLKRHLSGLAGYEGDFDILVTATENGPVVKSLVRGEVARVMEAGRSVKFLEFEENRGWAWSRNRAIKHAMENGYELLCMMDGDIWVEDRKWILKAQRASEAQPVFMCRVHEPQYRKGRMSCLGTVWDLYDEWVGCINVARRAVLTTVGGYNHVELPQQWGYHDCEWGRRLVKAGCLGRLHGLYPSLADLGTVQQQDSEYDRHLDELKKQCVARAESTFWQMHHEIQNGTRPVFFDYNIGQ